MAHALAAEGVGRGPGRANQGRRWKRPPPRWPSAADRRAIPVVTDTGDDESVKALVAHAVEELGGVDILINNASNQAVGAGFPDLAGTSDEAFWADVNIKVVGYLRTARAVAPHLVAQGWGRIINVSGLGYRQTHSIVRSIRNVSVAALTREPADELGPHGINVTVVQPGQTRTETKNPQYEAAAKAVGIEVAAYEKQIANNAIGRVVDATEVADVIALLASPRSVEHHRRCRRRRRWAARHRELLRPRCAHAESIRSW